VAQNVGRAQVGWASRRALGSLDEQEKWLITKAEVAEVRMPRSPR
jgi:hypothetical protein